MTRQTETALLSVILALFVLVSTTYSLVVPPFEASDELWHYPMVKHVADNWSLPVQNADDPGPWRQEGSQPPLYYFLGALSTFWIDTSDMSEVRHLNPRVDNGIATPDGNVNLVVHRPEREAFPWKGTILAVHVVRFLSILMATAGVYLTYLIAREIMPQKPMPALGATAIHAFTPMVAFIAGSVNNDNLVVPLSGLALLVLLHLLRSKDLTLLDATFRYLLLGVVLGLVALTKASTLGLTLLTALVVTIRAARRSSHPRGRRTTEGLKEFVIGGLATVLPLIVIAGWWYLRNLRLYGDLSGLSAFIETAGRRDVAAGLGQLWRERYSFFAGYWGNFGGLNVPMVAWVYTILNGIVVIAGLGLVTFAIRTQVRHSGTQSAEEGPGTSEPRIWAPGFLLCILWALAVLIPWTQWARVTPSSQGRLVFPALPVWSMLLTLGLSAWLPGSWKRWAVGIFALFLLALSAAAPFIWIQPAYARPSPLTEAQVETIPNRANVDFGNTMRLLGYRLETSTTEPGDQLAVTLYWEALSPTEVDYTVFVHLLGEHELIVAQRDTYPGLGSLSTTWLEPDFRWADRYVLQLPATAYAPNEAQVEVGLFNARTGQRLQAVKDGEPIGDNLRFGHVTIQALPDAPPNPVSINVGNRMLLTGYDLSQRIAQPGETITLTLRWQALRPMEQDYTVSSQLVDAAQRKAAQHDSPPLQGAAPTTTWTRDQTVLDAIPLTVYPDAGAGIYDVRIAVYVHDEGQITHLPVTPPGGQMQANHVELTQVRVAP